MKAPIKAIYGKSTQGR